MYLEINLLEVTGLLFGCQIAAQAYTGMKTPGGRLREHLIGHLEATEFCSLGRNTIEK